MEEEIEDNYFYRMFQKEYQRHLLENMRNKIEVGKEKIDPIVILMFPTQYFQKEEILEAYNNGLFQVCTDYISLSNSKLDIFSSNPFEIMINILNEMEENPCKDTPYKYSFLLSLKFIYPNYLECLGVGCPIMFPMVVQPKKDTQDSFMAIILNSHYQLLQFSRINISHLEQAKIMTEFVIMQKNKQIGPLQKVKYYYQ